jgi:hypothetical protein
VIDPEFYESECVELVDHASEADEEEDEESLDVWWCTCGGRYKGPRIACAPLVRGSGRVYSGQNGSSGGIWQ